MFAARRIATAAARASLSAAPSSAARLTQRIVCARPLSAAAVGPRIENLDTDPTKYAVVVSEQQPNGPAGEGRYQNMVTAHGKHQFVADEPLNFVGGTDVGPSPYDLLLSSVGACTNMTIRVIAHKRGWPLERVTTWLRHDRIPAKDCPSCENKEGFVDRISRFIKLEGPLTDDQKADLLQISTQCPVSKTLSNEIIFPIKLI